ncbi:transposase family protein [Streptomyces bacillaris]|uniref:transposase family protein n=1 Tax=Streptomyces bacillaris TaxID=68179 RepID=UPI0033476ED0
MVFVDRLLATLVHLRHGVTHDVLACCSTVTRAIGEVRPLLAERGCTISPDVRLRTLAEVIEHLGQAGKTGIIDGTEIRVRRPAVGRKDRDCFISGKNKQNAVKAMVLTDADGRMLFCSPTRPGSCADITHARALGLVKLLADGPAVEILADAGCQGLGAQTGGRVVTPPHRKYHPRLPLHHPHVQRADMAEGHDDPMRDEHPVTARQRHSSDFIVAGMESGTVAGAGPAVWAGARALR